ncbi:hypothetical protein [Opitutus sp. GAS368]|jgi:hypothetical protein|uniref:hypothetical protein n=1 Tax=Opitutus sp. GAS368 TaxID=1882749 RepID=UPI00087BC596|nr:hypothetical protein [Opitutus sp. GAS368]SDR86992.1 hypothetical protein SAMN05444173_1167 [Opitutus sp. GAS368]
MKTVLRSLVMSALLISVTPVFALANTVPAPLAVSQTKLASAPTIVSQHTALSAAELAKYQQLEQAAKAETEKQAAGEGLDKSTWIIIGVIAVVVVVAVAAGGGGGGGSGGGGY